VPKNRPIEEFMTRPLSSAAQDDTLSDIITRMEEEKIRHLPILENGNVVGLISDRDIKVFRNMSWAEKFMAKDIMIKDVYKVNAGTALKDVIDQMINKKFGSALVLNNEGKLEGIFTSTDALKVLKDIL